MAAPRDGVYTGPATTSSTIRINGTSINEAHRPNTSGNTGTEECTVHKKNCGNGSAQNNAAIAASLEKFDATVNLLIANINSGASLSVKTIGNTDTRCEEKSAGGNISCGPKLANDRGTDEANDYKRALEQAQKAGQIPADVRIVVVPAGPAGRGMSCVPSTKVICFFATGEGNGSGRRGVDTELTTTTPVMTFDACPVVPGNQAPGTLCPSGIPVDACPDDPGFQSSGPCGSGKPPVDVCPDMAGFQSSGPCTVPPIDVCPDMAGFQSSGPCSSGNPPVDVCPDMAGFQSSGPCTVPPIDACPDVTGFQATGPCTAQTPRPVRPS